MQTPSNQQIEIVDLYEKYQLEEGVIASELHIDKESVTATLMQFSKVYKRLHTQLRDKEDKTNDEYDELLYHYKTLAMEAEDEGVRERALRNLMDEIKGRNDVALKKLELDRMTQAKPVVNNITVFNMLLAKGREQKLKLLEPSNAMVTVDAEEVKQNDPQLAELEVAI